MSDNRAKIRTLPRLNRAGNGIRKHRLNPQKLREIAVKEEIEHLKTVEEAKEGSKVRRKARPGLQRPPKQTKDGRINLKAFGATDPKTANLQSKLRELDDEMVEEGRKSRNLLLEEKIFILEHYFHKNWGPKKISKILGRASSTVTRFIDKYRSTATMAKLHIEAQAENLAKRVTAKANVEEAMEVLDRIDVLPKKERNKTEGTSFNIIVGMPSTQAGAGTVRPAIPVPSQKQIEAARGSEQ